MMPSQLFDFKAKIKFGSKELYSGSFDKHSVQFFENLVKQGIVNKVTKKIHSKFGPRVWDITEFLATVSDEDLQSNALLFLNSRMEEAYERKFKSKGFGTWSQIKLNTIRSRERLRNNGKVKPSVGWAGVQSPLWFTGRLMSAVQEGFKITDFKAFSRDDVKSRGKDVSLISSVSPIDMKVSWIEPKGAWSSTPDWYKRHSKSGGLNSFEELVAVQTFGGSPSNIPKRHIPLWALIKEGKSSAMGESKQFKKEVWSPFLKNDFAGLFERTKKRKISKVNEVAVKKLSSLSAAFAQQFGLSEETYRKRLKSQGIPQDKIETSIKVQYQYLESLRKKET